MKEIHELYEKYYTTVMRYALSLTRNYHLAEDITQEAFLKAILSVHKFKGECKVSVWLCQIVKNLYFDECRKRKREQPFDETISIQINSQGRGTPEKEALEKELVLEAFQCVEQLEGVYQEVFILRHFQELSFKEIGAMYRKSESWARVTYYRAKEQIRYKMTEDFGNEM